MTPPTIRTDPLIRRVVRHLRQFIARRRLQRMVEQSRNSFETERYRRNRAAQIARRFKGERA